jgi:hypothetical protein
MRKASRRDSGNVASERNWQSIVVGIVLTSVWAYLALGSAALWFDAAFAHARAAVEWMRTRGHKNAILGVGTVP